MTVERLHPVLTHYVVNTLGWRSLRPLQMEAIAPILDGQDAVLLAPTAGGKTEAAVLPRRLWPILSILDREEIGETADGDVTLRTTGSTRNLTWAIMTAVDATQHGVQLYRRRATSPWQIS